MIGMCNVPPKGLNMSSIMISNTTAIKEVIEREFKKFQSLKARYAFFHWYKCEGLEEEDFA